MLNSNSGLRKVAVSNSSWFGLNAFTFTLPRYSCSRFDSRVVSLNLGTIDIWGKDNSLFWGAVLCTVQ